LNELGELLEDPGNEAYFRELIFQEMQDGPPESELDPDERGKVNDMLKDLMSRLD
jgi:hypothetical protein